MSPRALKCLESQHHDLLKPLGCKKASQGQGCFTTNLKVKDILVWLINTDEVHQCTWEWASALLARSWCILSGKGILVQPDSAEWGERVFCLCKCCKLVCFLRCYRIIVAIWILAVVLSDSENALLAFMPKHGVMYSPWQESVHTELLSTILHIMCLSNKVINLIIYKMV